MKIAGGPTRPVEYAPGPGDSFHRFVGGMVPRWAKGGAV